MIKVFGKTDTGLKRDHNEDAIDWSEMHGLVILADGMGGHNAGEVASEMAVASIQQQLSNGPVDNPVEAIKSAVDNANKRIHQKSQESLICAGMGTTVVVTLFDDSSVTFAHVGDSRLYLIRDGELKQLTSDHSLVQELVDEGFMNEAEAHESISNNVITRALGTEPVVQIDIQQQQTSSGDCYLLCSDGLSDMIETSDILSIIGEEGSLEQKVDHLIDLANRHGGSDNISAIVVDIL